MKLSFKFLFFANGSISIAKIKVYTSYLNNTPSEEYRQLSKSSVRFVSWKYLSREKEELERVFPRYNDSGRINENK